MQTIHIHLQETEMTEKFKNYPSNVFPSEKNKANTPAAGTSLMSSLILENKQLRLELEFYKQQAEGRMFDL